MDHANTLGLLAGTLTTVSFLPQVFKIWRAKSAKDISYAMFLTFSGGVFLWLLYGIAIGAAPVIVTNAVTFLLAVAVILLKMRYK